MPRDIERLHVLTLAAADAVRRGEWDGLGGLLKERGRLLETLGSQPLDASHSAALVRVRQADALLAQALADARAETVDAIARAQSGRRLATAYSSSPHVPFTDRVG